MISSASTSNTTIGSVPVVNAGTTITTPSGPITGLSGSLTNLSSISGTLGASNTGNGSAGSAGVYADGGTVTNDGTITGGSGGDGGGGLGMGGSSASGGAGGVGVSLPNGTLTNDGTGTITGGSGGSGRGYGGDGGAGVLLTYGTLTNEGSITGGSGGGSSGSGGKGGAGVSLAGGTLTNDGTGTITGGSGGGGGFNGGAGGAGVSLTNGTLTNDGTITGGSGSYGGANGGAGGAGVYVDGGTVTNAGTIAGGAGGTGGAGSGAAGDAVQFGANAATLMIDPTAVFVGNVVGNGQNDKLVLASATVGDSGTITGLGTQFTGFSTLDVASGATWTEANASESFTGTVTVEGNFTNLGTLSGTDGVTNPSGSGGVGGVGVSLTNGTLTNDGTGTITGGSGGGGGGTFSGGGDGGAGVYLDGGTVTNDGTITGGLGGFGEFAGGVGGAGVSLTGGTLTNDGTITGGGSGGGGIGGGGAGASLTGGTLTNDGTGTIAGGSGGNGGAGGVGVSLTGGTLTNDGTITGGSGGGNGGAGVYVDGGTVTNAGTIAGGAGGTGHSGSGAAGDAVQFGANAATLMIDPTAVFVGNVVGNGQNNKLVLASATMGDSGTITGLGTQFTGFSALDVASGATWTEANASESFTGTVTVEGNFTNLGTLSGPAGVNSTGGVGVSLTGGTLTNDGTITGGSGGYGGDTFSGGGRGGAGVYLDGGTVTNDGTITGGVGGGGGSAFGGAGGAGVYVDGGTVTNAGTIAGGTGGTGGLSSGAAGDAVQFGANAATLVIDPGAVLQGNVVGDGSNDSLIFAAGSGTLDGFGSTITGIGSITCAQGADWTIGIVGNNGTFGGTLYGFGTADQIDLQNLGSITSYTADSGNLFTFTGSKASETVSFDAKQSFAGYAFKFAGDGQGGTDVTLFQPAPVLTAATPGTVEAGQTIVIGTVSPGAAGDALSVALTSGSGEISLGNTQPDGSQTVIYTAPGAISTSQIESLSYTVTDSINGKSTKGTASVQLDRGPSITNGQAEIGQGTSVNLTQTLLNGVTPGLSGDHEMITSVTASAGQVSLDKATGAVSYTAPTQGGDTISYTVTDQYGGTASGTLAIGLLHNTTTVHLNGFFNSVSAPTVPAPYSTAQGPAVYGRWYGFSTIEGTGQSQLLAASGWFNTIVAKGGNDVINAGQGFAAVMVSDGNGAVTVQGGAGGSQVTLGDGADSVTLGGSGNIVTLGNGNDTVVVGLASAAHSGERGFGFIRNEGDDGGMGGSKITLGNGQDRVTLGGYGNRITVGNGNDQIVAGAGDAHVVAGNGQNSITLAGWGNRVTLGGGHDTVHAARGDAIALDGTNLLLEGGSGATLSFLGGTGASASITDLSHHLTVKVGPATGSLTLADVTRDPHFELLFTGGVGGFRSYAEIRAAMVSDGNGGTLLKLGNSAGAPTIDFLKTNQSTLKPSFFHFG
jgi:hypothetical protein